MLDWFDFFRAFQTVWNHFKLTNDSLHIIDCVLTGPPPFRLTPIGLPPIGLPVIGLPPFGLRGQLDYPHLDYPHLDYPNLD